ncbi:hypothetical protein ACJX0J_022440, partial [Zea mays]
VEFEIFFVKVAGRLKYSAAGDQLVSGKLREYEIPNITIIYKSKNQIAQLKSKRGYLSGRYLNMNRNIWLRQAYIDHHVIDDVYIFFEMADN